MKPSYISKFITKEAAADRFIRYASICTQSSDNGPEDITPSTPCQWDLARLLTKELSEMGASDVFLDEKNCYVYATVPGNIPVSEEGRALLAGRKDTPSKKRENTAPVIGLVAHMDTSDAVPASEFHPRLIPEYDGMPILLHEDPLFVTDPDQFEDLKDKIGKTLIVTDGTSVLGGDDKAGITEIMETAAFLLQHPEIAHGTLRIMFTPDEEIGNGVLHADLDRFAVDYAYTVDGGAVGELEYENFNAASLKLQFHGHSTHPGDAKGAMRNALLMAMEYNALLPAQETPFYTEGYEGFYHLENLSGTVDEASAEYLIRDHDMRSFVKRRDTAAQAAQTLRRKYGEETVSYIIEDTYYNMASKVKPHMHLIENAKKAISACGLTPVISPIRGGTDGCMLSYMGIPCPNLGTGSYHYHSRYEYVCVDEMVQSTEILIRILNTYAGFELDK